METSSHQDFRADASSEEELQLTKLETAFIVGIVGCLLFATWQLGDLLVNEVLYGWVGESELREDIIYYGVAFTASIAALVATTRSAFRVGRFGHTINRALMWYGALYVLQRRYFTQERILQRRLRNDTCPECGSDLRSEAHFCSQCGHRVGCECDECGGYVTRLDMYCATCGVALKKEE